MTLLPFTLEAWDHGRGLQPCTADGREVKQLTLFDVSDQCPLRGTVDGYLRGWFRNGDSPDTIRDLDLRLRPKTEKWWIVVCRTPARMDAILMRGVPKEKCIDEIWRQEIEVPV